MIKKITILILTFMTIQVNGQNILLSEDFNSGSIPSNFTTYDLDGQTLDPFLYTWMISLLFNSSLFVYYKGITIIMNNI